MPTLLLDGNADNMCTLCAVCYNLADTVVLHTSLDNTRRVGISYSHGGTRGCYDLSCRTPIRVGRAAALASYGLSQRKREQQQQPQEPPPAPQAEPVCKPKPKPKPKRRFRDPANIMDEFPEYTPENFTVFDASPWQFQ